MTMHRRGGDSVKQGDVVVRIKDATGKDLDVTSEYGVPESKRCSTLTLNVPKRRNGRSYDAHARSLLR